MIKATCSEGRVRVEMEGAFLEILSETCAMLNSIYGGVPEELREEFARDIHDKTAPGGLCWMTKEQRREMTAKMLRELLAKVEGKDEEPEGLGMRFEGEPVKADGDCSLEKMTRNAARMAMEKQGLTQEMGHPDPVGALGEPGPAGEW